MHPVGETAAVAAAGDLECVDEDQWLHGDRPIATISAAFIGTRAAERGGEAGPVQRVQSGSGRC